MSWQRKRQAVRRLAEAFLLNLPITILLGGGVPALGVMAGVLGGWVKIAIISVLVFFASLLAVSTWLRQSRSGGYQQVAANLARGLSGGGLPVIIGLGKLCSLTDPSDVHKAEERLVHNVLAAAKRTCSNAKVPEATRAAFYRRQQPDGHLHLVDDPLWGDGQPRRILGGEGEHDGDLVQFSMNPLRAQRVGDITKDESFLDVFEINPQYRSCVAVAVGVSNTQVPGGLLVVVSPDTKAFEQSDEEALKLLAGALAAGLAHVHHV